MCWGGVQVLAQVFVGDPGLIAERTGGSAAAARRGTGSDDGPGDGQAHQRGARRDGKVRVGVRVLCAAPPTVSRPRARSDVQPKELRHFPAPGCDLDRHALELPVLAGIPTGGLRPLCGEHHAPEARLQCHDLCERHPVSNRRGRVPSWSLHQPAHRWSAVQPRPGAPPGAWRSPYRQHARREGAGGPCWAAAEAGGPGAGGRGLVHHPRGCRCRGGCRRLQGWPDPELWAELHRGQAVHRHRGHIRQVCAEIR
mmetsp:Transcript_86902/g.151243  ORF Transcript_86902/g.151243 Transcript_86902/m.151243 type:complete len:254 (+) Transcript_86902:115-876(+)